MQHRVFLNRIICLCGTTAIVYIVLRYMLPLVVPFILAIIAATWIFPIVKRLTEKIRLPYKGVAILTVVGILTVVLFCGGGLVYILIYQGRRLFANMPFIQTEVNTVVSNLCMRCDRLLGTDSGGVYRMIENMGERVLPAVTDTAINVCSNLISVSFSFLFFVIATWLITEEYTALRDEYRSTFVYKYILPVIEGLKETLGGYLKTQGIIILVVFAICSVGLILLRNPYALLIGMVIAVLDAFPIIGSGSILVPWAIVYVFQGKIKEAVIISVTYFLCLCAREILEPKLMGQSTGLRPIYIFAAFYVGIKLFGISGIILGPVALVTIKTIYETYIVRNVTLS